MMLIRVREHRATQLVNPLTKVDHKLGLLLPTKAPWPLSLDTINSIRARVSDATVVQVASND